MTVRLRVTAHVWRSASSEPREVELSLPRPAAALRVLDALEEVGVFVGAFSCRSARCGACVAAVHDPSALLAPALQDELITLTQLAAGAGERLGCQITLRPEAEGELSVCFRR